MKTKTKQIIGIIAFIVLIVLFASYFNKTFSITGISYQSATSELVSDDIDSATYLFTFGGGDGTGQEYGCDAKFSEDFDFGVTTIQSMSSRPKFVSGLREDVYTEAVQTEYSPFSLTVNSCSDNAYQGQVILAKNNVTCKIHNMGIYNGYDRAEISCQFKGLLESWKKNELVGGQFNGFKTGKVLVKFYKEGYPQSIPEVIIPETNQSQENRTEITENPSQALINQNFSVAVIIAIVLITSVLGIFTFLIIKYRK